MKYPRRRLKFDGRCAKGTPKRYGPTGVVDYENNTVLFIGVGGPGAIWKQWGRTESISGIRYMFVRARAGAVTDSTVVLPAILMLFWRQC